MIIDKTRPASKIIDWMTSKNFNYDIDIVRSDPLHGKYFIKFKNTREEFMTRVRWGII